MSVIILKAPREKTAEERRECEVFTQNYNAHTAHTQEEIHRHLECNPLKAVGYVEWSVAAILGLFFLYWLWRNKK